MLNNYIPPKAPLATYYRSPSPEPKSKPTQKTPRYTKRELEYLKWLNDERCKLLFGIDDEKNNI